MTVVGAAAAAGTGWRTCRAATTSSSSLDVRFRVSTAGEGRLGEIHDGRRRGDLDRRPAVGPAYFLDSAGAGVAAGDVAGVAAGDAVALDGSPAAGLTSTPG